MEQELRQARIRFTEQALEGDLTGAEDTLALMSALGADAQPYRRVLDSLRRQDDPGVYEMLFISGDPIDDLSADDLESGRLAERAAAERILNDVAAFGDQLISLSKELGC